MAKIDKLTKIIDQQRFLEATADIDYQCYALDITPTIFWQVYLWEYLKQFDITFEDVKYTTEELITQNKTFK